MFIQKLTIKNFGPHSNLTINFKPITIIYGQALSGKSTLIDALQIGFSGKSNLTEKFSDIIKQKNNYSKIDVDFLNNTNQKHHINTVIFPEKTEYYLDKRKNTNLHIFTKDFCLTTSPQENQNFFLQFNQVMFSIVPEYEGYFNQLVRTGELWVKTLQIKTQTQQTKTFLIKSELTLIEKLNQVWNLFLEKSKVFEKLLKEILKEYEFSFSNPKVILYSPEKTTNFAYLLMKIRKEAIKWKVFDLQKIIKIKINFDQKKLLSHTSRSLWNFILLIAFKKLIQSETEKNPCLIFEFLFEFSSTQISKITKLITNFNQCIIMTNEKNFLKFSEKLSKETQTLKLEFTENDEKT